VERRRRAGRRLMSELVGLQSQTPDVLGKLSQLLTISGQRAQVQQEQQTARQRANLAKYDWNKHVGADGTIDIESLNDPELMHAAGDQYQNVLANAIATKQNQLSAQKTLIGLRGDQRQAFGEIMNGLRSDADVAEDNERGRQKVNEAMVQYGQQYGEQVLPVLEAYVKPLQKAPKGRLADALKIIGLQTESVDTQLSQQGPQYTNTGPELVDVNPNTAPGTSPKSLKLGLGPGMHILTDAKGATFAFNPQTNTVTPVGAGGRGPAPSGPAPTGPSPNAAPGSTFTQPSYQGQEKDISRNQDEVATTRAAADQAPANRNIFQHILSLADDTKTGPLISYLQIHQDRRAGVRRQLSGARQVPREERHREYAGDGRTRIGCALVCGSCSQRLDAVQPEGAQGRHGIQLRHEHRTRALPPGDGQHRGHEESRLHEAA
jgi:hypothetical protein